MKKALEWYNQRRSLGVIFFFFFLFLVTKKITESETEIIKGSGQSVIPKGWEGLNLKGQLAQIYCTDLFDW